LVTEEYSWSRGLFNASGVALAPRARGPFYPAFLSLFKQSSAPILIRTLTVENLTMETQLDQFVSHVSVPATPSAGKTFMEIKPNHKTFVRIDTPLAKVAPAVATLFHQFHSQWSDWRTGRLADLQCEAHVRGVTYMIRQRHFHSHPGDSGCVRSSQVVT
jgi:hypothetical protein